jgi:PKD repeat protein
MAVDIGSPTASDNCAVETVTSDAPATFPVGSTTITWTACDAAGNCDSCQQTVVVNCPPMCEVTYAPAAPDTGQDVTFNANASDPNPWSVIASYEWDFGDGETGSGDPATHTYADDGTYTVCVTVTDDQGAQAICCAAVTVSNRAPTCCYGHSPENVRVDRTVVFDGTCSTDPDGSIVSYDWTFGDGGTASGDTVTHVYLAEGSYECCLKVTDDDGAFTTCCTVIEVGPPPNEICVTLDGNRWHMMSLPCQAVNPDPWYVFNKNLPYGDPQAIDIHMNLHRYDPTAQGYVSYNYYAPGAFGPIEPGDGYWLWLFEDATICYDIECPSEYFYIDMPTAGWYLIGQPHPYDAWLDNPELEQYVWLSQGGGDPQHWADYIFDWVQEPLIYYDPGGYFSCGTFPQFDDHQLRQFRGYWVYTFVDQLSMIIPPP